MPSPKSSAKASSPKVTPTIGSIYTYLFIVTILMFVGFIMVYVSLRVETEAVVRRLTTLSERIDDVNGHVRHARPQTYAAQQTMGMMGSASESRVLATSPDGAFVLRGTGVCDFGPFNISPAEKVTDPKSGMMYRMYNVGYGQPESQDLGAVVRVSSTDAGLATTYPNVAFQQSGMMYRYLFTQAPEDCALQITAP